MKIVIIEEDIAAATYILKLLEKLSFQQDGIKIIYSISEAENFFRSHHATNLIFCNVTIAGKSSFTIFKRIKINTPVIYYADNTAAAPEAYKYNGIGYMLKPLTKKTIAGSIEHYKLLRDGFNNSKPDNIGINVTRTAIQNSSLIVTWKDKIIPLKIKDVALFNIDYKMTQAITFNNRKYFIANTLEGLEEICGTDFYRANRQFLINREAVAEAAQHFARKLVLKLKVEGEYEIIISKNRVPEFLNWLKE